jgi:hypothetical protein
MSAGIKGLQALLQFGIDLGVALERSLADDGKITVTDMAKFLGTIADVPGVFGSISDVPAEITDLDGAEVASLQQYVRDNFNIPEANIKAVVDGALQLAVDVFALIGAIKGLSPVVPVVPGAPVIPLARANTSANVGVGSASAAPLASRFPLSDQGLNTGSRLTTGPGVTQEADVHVVPDRPVPRVPAEIPGTIGHPTNELKG